MSQLKMYWLAGTPVEDMQLPQGYSFSNYKSPRDKMPWVECCKDGLVADDADEKTFDARIKRHKGIRMKKDVFFIDHNGEHVGTITAVYHRKENIGEIHMVGIRPDYRGKGLGRFINNIAVKKLRDEGVRYIYLTTDEWRKAAVKSYLTAGFVPVEYDEGMQQRWEAVITEYGIKSVDMVNEDGGFYTTIYSK